MASTARHTAAEEGHHGDADRPQPSLIGFRTWHRARMLEPRSQRQMVPSRPPVTSPDRAAVVQQTRETEIMKQSTRPAKASAASIALFLLTTTACGFPRPPDVGGDSPGDSGVPGESDGSTGPVIAIHVSPSGDDANDGFMLPVKTLKHAIVLAAANTHITQIALAAGTYSAASGETFPYIIPPNVTIVGSGDGGVILAGNKTEPGVILDVGGLQDLDLQDFATAIAVTGTANLKNIRVLTSTIAVQAEATASLTVNNLDITGLTVADPRPYSTGIVLNGAAKLVAMNLTTRGVSATLDARDQSVVVIANATISGNQTSGPIMSIMSTASFSLSDSLLDGGVGGLVIVAQSTSFHATISNTTIRNMKSGALVGFPNFKASFQMTGGELSNNGGSAAQLGQGIWTFTNVVIRQNSGLAFYLQDASLVMRNCTVVGNESGIDVFTGSTADLGTTVSPGGNVFQGNSEVGVVAESGVPVNAIGNTWNPNMQGADQNGKYPVTATIPGPVSAANNGNFAISDGSSLSR